MIRYCHFDACRTPLTPFYAIRCYDVSLFTMHSILFSAPPFHTPAADDIYVATMPVYAARIFCAATRYACMMLYFFLMRHEAIIDITSFIYATMIRLMLISLRAVEITTPPSLSIDYLATMLLLLFDVCHLLSAVAYLLRDLLLFFD